MKKLNYSIVGLDSMTTISLSSQLTKLKKYTLAASTENANKLIDVILSATPKLIFINVDDYSSKDFIQLKSTIKDLYRSFLQKPLLVAIASSKKHAYDCIKNDFYFYLLCPIEELQLRKLHDKLLKSTLFKAALPKKLCLQTYSDYRFIDIKNIIFLKADNNSTEFFMKDKTKVVAYKTLKHFEEILPNSFKRIHQSFVINQNYISRIHLGKSECQLKPLKMKLPFSKSYRKVMSDLATTLSSNALT